MTFYQETGELIFGSRLKRISDRFLMDVAKMYKSLNIPFEVSWFPLFYLLNERGTLSVTEIARELEITHSAVSQLVTTLEKKSLITFLNDKNDKRKRLIRFTSKGMNLMNRISPIWDTMRKTIRAMFKEGDTSKSILKALDQLEASMEKESVYERLMGELQKGEISEVEIVPYEPKCKTPFKNLILNYFIENANKEISDVELLNNPDEKIQKGLVNILMAKGGGEWIGTLVAQKNKNGKPNIKYLIVDTAWRKYHVEDKLKKELSQI